MYGLQFIDSNLFIGICRFKRICEKALEAKNAPKLSGNLYAVTCLLSFMETSLKVVLVVDNRLFIAS